MEKWATVIKTLLGIAGIFILVMGADKFMFGKYDYEGADEPGYTYPEEVRTEVVDRCNKSFRKLFSVTEEQVESLCTCYLESLEERYSFEEFDKKLRDRLMDYRGLKIERLLHKCAQQNGLRIN